MTEDVETETSVPDPANLATSLSPYHYLAYLSEQASDGPLWKRSDSDNAKIFIMEGNIDVTIEFSEFAEKGGLQIPLVMKKVSTVQGEPHKVQIFEGALRDCSL